MNFSDFEALLRTYPASKIEEYQKAHTLKASLLGKVASKRLVEQEEDAKKLSKESRRLKHEFNLAQAANLDLEKKVPELAEALKKCQDEKKILEDEKKAAHDALKNSKKDLEKLQNTHDEDLKLIENLRKDHDKSSKVVEDLRINNADLAKTLGSKEQKIQDLEKALADQDETSGKDISEIKNKLKLLFEEYGKSLREFGIRPAPFPTSTKISDFMNWIETEFKALPGVISGASDFAAGFSVESILKLLHDFDCADLVKFREKLSHFPDALRTSRIYPNEEVLAIKAKFAREFWFASGKEVAKNISRAKLDQVSFSKTLLVFCKFASFPSLVFLSLSVCSFQLIQEETRGRSIEAPESSSEAEDNKDADDGEKDSGEEGGDGSSSGDNGDDDEADASFNHDDSSPKVAITG
jgi:hypothetical protein